MVIEFSPEIFEVKDFKSFNYLFQTCTIGERYEILADYVKVVGSPVFKRMDIEDQELIIRNFDAQMTKQGGSGKVGRAMAVADYTVGPNPNGAGNIFNIAEATAFFGQRISVIIENSLNDSHFIKAVIAYFDQAGALRRHLDNKWISFENAGGCTNVENLIKGKLTDFEGLPKDPKYYFRALVFLDSDREYPGQHLHYKHRNLLTYLREQGIGFHVFEKRMMENYMPDEVVASYSESNLQPWINAYIHLSDVQKDFLGIVKGFSKKDGTGAPKKKRDELETGVIAFYSDVSDKNFDILDQAFKLEDFKEVFPLNFTTNTLVNANSLSQKIAHQQDPQEFNTIVTKLNNLI